MPDGDIRTVLRKPWNKGVLVGQKKPLKPSQVWSIRVRLELAGTIRELAMFNLAIDSKLRASDLVKLRLEDVCSGQSVKDRATVVQQKTQHPVHFEITEGTRYSIQAILPGLREQGSQYLFPSRSKSKGHMTTRQYARIVRDWIKSIGLDPALYGTHTMRRTKAAQIYRRTGNLRAVQLLLGHTKLESTVRYLGFEVDDALALSEQIDL
jgi:site-specific recombinase XerD